MARRNGEPGRSGSSIAVVGVLIAVFGLFVGRELRGLEALGFVILLGGFLTTVFGVLREVSDRRH